MVMIKITLFMAEGMKSRQWLVTCGIRNDKRRKPRLEEWVLFLALAKLSDVSSVMLLCLH